MGLSRLYIPFIDKGAPLLTVPIVPVAAPVWVEVHKELKVGQASGCLGLTYATQSFDETILKIKTDAGLIISHLLK